MSVISLQKTCEQLLNIGEYGAEGHWKNCSLIRKILDVFLSFTRCSFFPAICVGAVLFFCIADPHLLLVIIASVTLALTVIWGGALIRSLIQMHKIHQFESKIIPDKAVSLGGSSENDCFITKDGAESLNLKLQLIKAAQQSIEISGSYCGGKVFQDVLEEIDNKLSTNKEIKIRILSNNDFLTDKNKFLIKSISSKYPEQFFLIEVIKPLILLPTLRTISNHTKFVIVDGSIGITGGTGIQDVFNSENEQADDATQITLSSHALKGGVRDTDILIHGPLVQCMRKQFFHLLEKWDFISGENHKYGSLGDLNVELNQSPVLLRLENLVQENERQICKRVVASMVVGSYEQGRNHGCKRIHMEMIRSAKKTLSIAHMCINHDEVVQALEEAALRDVKITIVTNGASSAAPMSAKILAPANRGALARLLNSGKDIHWYEYGKNSVFYHKKVMVVDEKLVAMGSYNLAFCSDPEDENSVIFESEELVKTVCDLISEDIKVSRKIPQDYYSGLIGKVRLYSNNLLRNCILSVTKNIFQ